MVKKEKKKLRSIFISDIHLGSKGAQAEALLDFLKHHESEYLYIVGDFIDFWALKSKLYFPQSHVTVLQKVLKRARNGTKVFYLPGNHDENFRDFMPLQFGEIAIQDTAIHTTAAGKQYLVIHGDAYDQVVKYARWLAFLGHIGYNILLRSNTTVNWVRRKFGYGYWSLSAYMKGKVKSAVGFIGNYEQAVVTNVRELGVDGVICGHIHSPEDRMIDGVHYVNDGDWVESCTALIENIDGSLEIVYWPHHQAGMEEAEAA